MSSAQSLAALLAPEVLARIAVPYAIFGHSTGALCAFELTREIRRLGGPAPTHLFVAGRGAPQRPVAATQLEGLTIAEFADFLRSLGGTPEEILSSPEILTRIRPLLIADFSVNEAYVYRPEPPLSVPITVFAATHDKPTMSDQAAWEDQTSAGFTMHTLNGGHFAVFDYAPDVHRRIASAIQASSA